MPKAQDLLRRIGEQPHVARLVARRLRRRAYDLDHAHYCRRPVLFAFAKLADAVGDGGTRAFDEWLLVSLRTPGNLADPDRAQVVRGDDARFHGARQHRAFSPSWC